MDPNTKNTALGAAGAGAAAGLGVEDVFSTWLYTGNGGTQTITNGIDLAGEGGLVFGGHRNGTSIGNLDRFFYDTERGTGKALYPSSTSGQVTDSNGISAFNSDGFTLPSGNARHNDNGYAYASWTFRKAPGFFDVVTYTGDANTSKTISHNLGCVPGCIIVKCTSGAGTAWAVYHRSLGATKYLNLNSTISAGTSTGRWNDTAPTATEFTVGNNGDVNGTGHTFVAYLFAHDEQIFGESGSESVIQCGSFAHTNGTVPSISLGYEPQWVLIKNTTGSGSWLLFDNMRGMPVGSSDSEMYANSSAAESNTTDWISPNATGFTLPYFSLLSSNTFIYIAIRRGPMKTPTDATTVFGIEKLTGSQSSPAFRTGVLTDMGWARRLSNGSYYGDGVGVFDRLRGDKGLATGSTAAEYGDSFAGDNMIGFYSSAISGDIGYSFRRAPGFFDVVAYTGTDSDLTVNHNLGKAPELIIARNRSTGTGRWYVYPGPLSSSEQKHFRLNETLAVSSSASLDWAPTSTTFNADTFLSLSTSGTTYIAYLFATVSGVSKVGSYSGTGSNINVDCGFSAGARFVLIKRTDSTGDWYVWDTARGIVSGNDPYVVLNTNVAEVTTTDYIDPYTSGFTVTSTAPAALNASGGNYIFLAIA